MFIDEIKVYARSGHGGKGAVAFTREKYRPKGGPSGGNGGRGGDVILEADHDYNNLIGQFYQPRLIAQDGQGGLGKGMDGHAGKDMVVKVPCGTMVLRLPSDPVESKPEDSDDAENSDAPEQEQARPTLSSATAKRPVLRTATHARGMEMNLEDEPEVTAPELAGEPKLIADLTEHGQRFVLCKGGRGGLGNRNFASATRQTPRFAQPGESGEEGNFLLELRMIAEVGLVGYPNAGKSTLLTAISHARPKIAPYPFTTLHPQIGILEYPDFHRLTICDVPGLIEGAHQDVGLGHSFLKHIERCKLLIILLDMAGTDGRPPWDDYQSLLRELELYDPALLERPRMVVANKMDEAVAEQNLKSFKRRIRKTSVLPISAAFGEGVDRFKEMIREGVAAADQKPSE